MATTEVPAMDIQVWNGRDWFTVHTAPTKPAAEHWANTTTTRYRTWRVVPTV